MCERCGVRKPRKTEYSEDVLKFLSGDFGPERQGVLIKTFNDFPVYQIRKLCLEKIIPEGKEIMIWLLESIADYLTMKDHVTVLLFLEKLSQFEGEFQEDAFGTILASIYQWLEEDNRTAIKLGLDIVYKKIEKNPSLYWKQVRELFQAVLEKYDNDMIERSEDDFKMLGKLVRFINRIDKGYFIPIFRKTAKTRQEFKEMQEPDLFSSSCGKSISQVMFEMDKGLIAGTIKVDKADKAQS